LVDIIEGESLVNDATGLLALELGTAMLLAGTLPSVTDGTLRFVYVCVVGVGAGVAIGFLAHHLERLVDDAPIVITISVLVPYAAYFAADILHASGVLAVVACGLYGSRKGDEYRSAHVRLDAGAVWNALAFILNGLVFILIGLQLRPILISLGNVSFGTLLLEVLIFSVVVIALRLIWVYPAMTVGRLVANRLLYRHEPPLTNRGMFVVGWASMRGVIALAAALSLPRILPDGRPFAQRTMIIVLTFGAIFFSLVLRGLTFPTVIRRLGLAGTAEPEVEEIEARRIVLDSAMRHLEERREEGAVFDEHDRDLKFHYGARLAAVNDATGDEHGSAIEHSLRYTELSRELLNVQRQTAIRLRNEGRISDDVLRDLLAELDLAETRLKLDLNRLSARASIPVVPSPEQDNSS
ncbi:MAG: cation:proton antiporter, partial [Thermoanaerobaculia bacterium]